HMTTFGGLLRGALCGLFLPIPRAGGQQRRDYFGGARLLTGTYQLDSSRSEDVWQQARRATRGMTADEQERLRQVITRRLSPPDVIAIDRHFRTVTIASSLGPQVTLEADGRTVTEQTPRGRTLNVNALMTGDRLTVNATG